MVRGLYESKSGNDALYSYNSVTYTLTYRPSAKNSSQKTWRLHKREQLHVKMLV